MARHKHDRNGRKGELYLENAFGGGGGLTIKRGKYYYLASIPWEEICYIVIFPEGNGFLSYFFSGFREMAWEMVLYNTGIQ